MSCGGMSAFTEANRSIGTNGKAPYSNGSIGDYASHQGDLDYFVMWSGWVQGNSDGPVESRKI